jgi:reactive intermediate/imine deaminase
MPDLAFPMKIFIPPNVRKADRLPNSRNCAEARFGAAYHASAFPRENAQMSDIVFHLIPDAPKPVAPYSHVVECGGWLFVTGQLATDPDDDSLPIPDGIEAQTHKVMDNLNRALGGVGAGLDRVVFARVFRTEFERDYAAMNAIYRSYFDPAALPGRTTVGVTHLARGGLIEIDMIARRP